MTIDEAYVDNQPVTDPRRLLGRYVGIAAAAGVAIWFLSVAGTGLDSPRVSNPEPRGTVVYDGVFRAHPPLWNFDYWPYLMQIVTVVVALGFWTYFIVKSLRARKPEPGLILMVASTLLLVFDPIVNWAAYVVFDPRLLHLPIDWPYANIAPLVEPLFVVAGYPFYLIIPGMIGVWLDRRFVEQRVRDESWLARHNLVRVFLISMGVAIAFDFAAELSMVRTELWIYSQAPPPVIHIGPHQWSVLWEPLLFAPTMAVTGAMLVRDDRGRTMMHRTAQRIRFLKPHAFIGPVLVAFCVYSITYMGLYTGAFTLFRLTGFSSSLSQPFPFEDAKVYDPHGTFENNGESGPYYEGTWSGPKFDDDDAG